MLLWSTVATAFKITLQYFTPLQMVFFASVVTVICLGFVAAFQQKLTLLLPTFKAKPLLFLASGLINPVIYYWVLFKAYDLLPASQAQPLNYSWAITLSLLSVPFLGQSFSRRDAVACVLAYAGVVVIATQGNILAMDVASPLGVGLALLSTLLWAGYWIINTKNNTDPVVSLLLCFMVSLPLSFGLCFYLDGMPQLTLKAIASISYVGLFEMGVTFLFWLMAMKKAKSTAQLSNLIFLSPFISLWLLAQVIGEAIHLSSFVGLGLIVLGLVFQNLKR